LVGVNLIANGGEHKGAEYTAVNPVALVPSLKLASGDVLTESLGIIEYLEEAYPDYPLLPKYVTFSFLSLGFIRPCWLIILTHLLLRDLVKRAQIRAVALVIGSDIQPIQNLRVLDKIATDYSGDKAVRFVAKIPFEPSPCEIKGHICRYCVVYLT
jgi:maleylacetoacetate isomerase/maleylpyruvate isomerase